MNRFNRPPTVLLGETHVARNTGMSLPTGTGSDEMENQPAE